MLLTLLAAVVMVVVLVAVSVDRKVIHLLLVETLEHKQVVVRMFRQVADLAQVVHSVVVTPYEVALHVVVLRLVQVLVGQEEFMVETGDLLLAVTDVMLVVAVLVTTAVQAAVEVPTVEMVAVDQVM